MEKTNENYSSVYVDILNITVYTDIQPSLIKWRFIHELI